MSTASIILLIVLFAALAVGGYFAYKNMNKKQPRKFMELKTGGNSGKCAGTGTVSKKVKSSDDCAAACDESTCNGYDWDDSTCTLYSDIPKSVSVSTSAKDKCYVPALTN